MDNLRTPFFILALFLIGLVVIIEVGDTALLNAAPVRPNCSQQDSQDLRDACAKTDLSAGMNGAPGKAIPFLALLDGVAFFIAGLIGLGLFVKPSVLGRIQGCGTLVFSILIILGGIGMAFAALGLLLLMIGLLLSFPFGTIAYMILYGHFDTDSARVVLSLLMTLKLGYAVLLLFSHQRFMQNVGLMLIIVTSILANIIITFLIGFPPGFLASITDDIAAIVVVILAIIWGVVLLIFSIPAILKTLRTGRV